MELFNIEEKHYGKKCALQNQWYTIEKPDLRTTDWRRFCAAS